MANETSGIAQLSELATPEVRAILEQARDLVRSTHPDAAETVWVRQRIVSFGFGPRKMSEHYAYLQVHARHLNLGFYHSDKLSDPEKLLEGSGQKLRHIKLASVSDIGREGVRNMICRAMNERRDALRRDQRG